MTCAILLLSDGLTEALAKVEEPAKVAKRAPSVEYCNVEGSGWRHFGSIMLMT